jgi:hypothetical protein
MTVELLVRVNIIALECCQSVGSPGLKSNSDIVVSQHTPWFFLANN